MQPAAEQNAPELRELFFGDSVPSGPQAQQQPVKEPADVAALRKVLSGGLDNVIEESKAARAHAVATESKIASERGFVERQNVDNAFFSRYGDAESYEAIPEAERKKFEKARSEAPGIVSSAFQHPMEAGAESVKVGAKMVAGIARAIPTLATVIASKATGGDGEAARTDAVRNHGTELDKLAMSGAVDKYLSDDALQAVKFIRSKPKDFELGDGTLDAAKMDAVVAAVRYGNPKNSLEQNYKTELEDRAKAAEGKFQPMRKRMMESIENPNASWEPLAQGTARYGAGRDMFRGAVVDAYVRGLGKEELPAGVEAPKISEAGAIQEGLTRKDVYKGALEGATGTSRLISQAAVESQATPEESAKAAFDRHRAAVRQAQRESGVEVAGGSLEHGLTDAAALADPTTLATAGVAGAALRGATKLGSAALSQGLGKGIAAAGSAIEDVGTGMLSDVSLRRAANAATGTSNVNGLVRLLRLAEEGSKATAGTAGQWTGRIMQGKAPTYMIGKYGPGVAEKMWQGTTFGALADAAGESDPSAALAPFFSGAFGLHAIEGVARGRPISEAVLAPARTATEFAADLITKRNEGGGRKFSHSELADNRFVKEHIDAMGEGTRSANNTLANFIRSAERINPEASMTVLTEADFPKAAELHGIDPKAGAFTVLNESGQPQAFVKLKKGVLENSAHELGEIWRLTNLDTEGNFKTPQAEQLYGDVVSRMRPEDVANIRKNAQRQDLSNVEVANEFFADQLGHWMRDVNGDTSTKGSVRNVIGSGLRTVASKMGTGRSMSEGGTHGNKADLGAMAAFDAALGEGQLPRVGSEAASTPPAIRPKDLSGPVESSSALRQAVAERARVSVDSNAGEQGKRIGAMALADADVLPTREHVIDRIKSIAKEQGVALDAESLKHAEDTFNYYAGREHRTVTEAREASEASMKAEESRMSAEEAKAIREAVGGFEQVVSKNRYAKSLEEVVYPPEVPAELAGTRAENRWRDAVRSADAAEARLYKTELDAAIKRNAVDIPAPPEHFSDTHPLRLAYEDAVSKRADASLAAEDAAKKADVATTQANQLHELARAVAMGTVDTYLASAEAPATEQVARRRELAAIRHTAAELKAMTKDLKDAAKTAELEALKADSQALGINYADTRRAVSAIASSMKTANKMLPDALTESIRSDVEAASEVRKDGKDPRNRLVELHARLTEEIRDHTIAALNDSPRSGVPSELGLSDESLASLVRSKSTLLAIESAASQIAASHIAKAIRESNRKEVKGSELDVPQGIADEAKILEYAKASAKAAAETDMGAAFEQSLEPASPAKRALVERLSNSSALGKAFEVGMDSSDVTTRPQLMVVTGRDNATVELASMTKLAKSLTDMLNPKLPEKQVHADSAGKPVATERAAYRNAARTGLSKLLGSEVREGDTISDRDALRVYSAFSKQSAEGRYSPSGVDLGKLSASLIAPAGESKLTPADRSSANALASLTPAESLAIMGALASQTSGRTTARDVAVSRAAKGFERIAARSAEASALPSEVPQGTPATVASVFGLRPIVSKVSLKNPELSSVERAEGVTTTLAPYRPWSDASYASEGSVGAAFAGRAAGRGSIFPEEKSRLAILPRKEEEKKYGPTAIRPRR